MSYKYANIESPFRSILSSEYNTIWKPVTPRTLLRSQRIKLLTSLRNISGAMRILHTHHSLRGALGGRYNTNRIWKNNLGARNPTFERKICRDNEKEMLSDKWNENRRKKNRKSAFQFRKKIYINKQMIVKTCTPIVNNQVEILPYRANANSLTAKGIEYN